MSPESNVKDKPLTVTMAPPPAALAAAKKKAEGAKRSVVENVLDGHAGTIKGEGPAGEALAAQERKQGRTGAGVGFVLLGLAAFLQLTRHGRFLHEEVVNGATVHPTLTDAYHKLGELPWLFDLTTRLVAFRIFASLSVFFFLALTIFPGTFGRYWMKLAGILGFVSTRVILGVMFYGVFTPFSIVMKVFGRDPLRLAQHEGSYWVLRPAQRKHDHFEHLS
jgi:hypothetical protein